MGIIRFNLVMAVLAFVIFMGEASGSCDRNPIKEMKAVAKLKDMCLELFGSGGMMGGGSTGALGGGGGAEGPMTSMSGGNRGGTFGGATVGGGAGKPGGANDGGKLEGGEGGTKFGSGLGGGGQFGSAAATAIGSNMGSTEGTTTMRGVDNSSKPSSGNENNGSKVGVEAASKVGGGGGTTGWGKPAGNQGEGGTKNKEGGRSNNWA